MCEQSCVATPRDKYHTELLSTITYFNDRNGAPLFNQKILDAIHRVIVEEEVDAHNFNVYISWKTPVPPNTQVENENTILTIQRLNNSGSLAEILKVLTINDAGYYESEKSYAKGDPAKRSKGRYSH